MTADAAITTLDRARELCPNPLDCLTERQRRAAQQRLLRIDALRSEVKARQHEHRVAAERLAAVVRDIDPIQQRQRQIDAEIADLGTIDGFDHSVAMTARWRQREALQAEQQRHAAYLRALTTRRDDLVQREADAHARLTRVLADIATLPEVG